MPRHRRADHVAHFFLSAWVDGVTSWVGVKGMVDEIQADLHQREEEMIVPGPVPNTTKVLRRKPFYAAQVLMRGLDLRTLLATFVDPLKQEVVMTAPSQRSNYRKHTELPLTPSSSWWYDLKDFVELDWDAPTAPTLHLLPLATCPRFTYFKQKSAGVNDTEPSKFGSEQSHGCFLGEEPCNSVAASTGFETHAIFQLFSKPKYLLHSHALKN